jgi:hypothetical protein
MRDIDAERCSACASGTHGGQRQTGDESWMSGEPTAF